MAIQLSVGTPYGSGVVATYHRITTTQVYYRDDVLDVTVMSYLDHDARVADAAPLGVVQARLTFADCADTTEPTRAQIYDALKALPAWAGATDC
jgi:hypothetical protein